MPAYTVKKYRLSTVKEFFICTKMKIRFGSVFMFTKWKDTCSKNFASLQNEKYVLEAFSISAKWKKIRFRCILRVYKIKKHVFQEFGIFTKWKNTFSKLFSCLQNRKARFWRVFYLCKMKQHVFETFCIFTTWKKKTFSKRVSSVQNEKYVLEAFSISTKWKNTFSKHFPCLQNDKTCFRSILQLYKMKKHVFETFSWLQEEKHVFEAFFKSTGTT